MSNVGILFEIREFSIFDGNGIRTTVFLKGCPLRCAWCHNPEGIRFEPEILFNVHKCNGCGNCKKVCPLPAGNALPTELCTVCGTCAKNCPTGARKTCGFRMNADELAEKLMKQSDVFAMSGGGVTFSGGEPLAQSDFIRDVMLKLRNANIHSAVETSGAVSNIHYQNGLEFADFVFQDLKHTNPDAFRHYTGGDLNLVLSNIDWLKHSGKPFIFRIPLIPNVNDSAECMTRFAEIAADAPMLKRVEILPYHLTAGAKYHLVGKTYRPEFSEERAHAIITAPFDERGVKWKIL